MASFEDLLWQTMPFAGARSELNGMATFSGGEIPPEPPMPSLVGPTAIPATPALTITKLSAGDDYTVPKPEIHADDYNRPNDVAIWCWEHTADAPWIIEAVSCRSRSSNYKSYRVLESIEWGFEAENAKGTLKSCVRITNLAGKRIELPLTKDFVAYKAAIRGGTIVKDQTDLWKLPAKLDQSLVIAFIYTLSPDKAPQAMAADAASALKDGFMPTGAAAAPVGAEVHGQATAAVDHPRVLVILSLTTCKQGDDFAPGAIVESGRIYPHIMVLSSMNLARIEATVRLNRPENTTVENDAVDRPTSPVAKLVSIFDTGAKYDGADCCAGPINSVLFADANDMELATSPGPPPPFWGNFFSYYLLDAYQTHKDRTFNMVSHDPKCCSTREADSLVVRQIVLGKSNYPKMKKLPYQGEFDNLHMAPKMRLHNVQKVTHVGVGTPDVDIDPSTLHLDDISMAPFCAHDCLHTHWRWSNFDTDPAQCGFDGMVPYAKPGKPLVPDNQTVQVWLRAPNQVTYTATVWAFPNQPIAHGQWQVVFHHGSGYALDITGASAAYIAKMAVDTLGGNPVFKDSDGTEISCTNSWSLLYWRLRWETVVVGLAPNNNPIFRERIQLINEAGAWAL